MGFIDKLKKRITISSRMKKLEQFYSAIGGGVTVLDVGVSNEVIRKVPDTTNYFLKNYQLPASSYTGLGIEPFDEMEKMHPGKRFVSYPGGRFPFKDDQFDWTFSNAVIEHVGNEDKQLEFINEMLRVSRNVFFTTPNKYFPVESHTNILFLHWNNYLFYKFCQSKPGLSHISSDSVYLFSRTRLKAILEKSNANQYKIISNRMGLITMTFTILCK